MEPLTPRSLIAGRVTARPGRELDTAVNAAAAVLGTDQLALVYSSQRGDLWYLAVPAADLASHVGSATPLAAALPGAPDHEGEGAYTADLAGGLQAVVVKNGQNLHSFVGTPQLVKRFIALEGAKATHHCASAGLPWKFPFDVIRRRDNRLNAAITLSGLTVAVLAAAAWLWAAYGASRQDELQAELRKGQLAAWATAVRSLEPQAYPGALANLNKAVEQAIKEKGVLLQFEHKAGRATWSLNANSRIVTGASN